MSHPTDDDLRALSLGQLAEANLASVCSHLADCPACCRRIDELGTDDPLLARIRQNSAPRKELLVTRAQRRSALWALRQGQEAEAPAPVIPPAPKQIGDYDILAEVGRGGMGVVYKARHRTLHRLAALKMVLAGEFASSSQELRFRLEAELAARVQHPHIVQVYEIGTHDGRPFLAMEWVEGVSLANRLDGKPWPADEAAALIETLARAIHVAHSEGVVHRDLKPANILLVSGGVVSGEWSQDTTHYSPLTTHHPKITDFGLAQPTEGAQSLTQSGVLVGTPGYMAPEQAGGKRALVGPATDVYALGVILYQMITGQLPFEGDSTLEVLRAVTDDEPIRPRRLRPGLPRDLEAITLHCLEKDSTRRYASALGLAEDLARFRGGIQVVARPVGAVARLARAYRRRPLVALLLALLTVSLFGGMAAVTWKWREANAHALEAIDEKREAQFQTYRARISAAVAALSAHDVADAAGQLEAAPEELRNWEWRHLKSRLDDSSAVIALPAGQAGLFGAPDRPCAWVMTSAGLRVTDLENGETTMLPIGPQRGHTIAVAQTGRGLRIVAWVGKTAFDLLDKSGQLLCHVDVPGITEPVTVFISPDGKRLAHVTFEGDWSRLAVFDASSGKRTALCDGHRDGVAGLTFSPDGMRLASIGEDRTARLWNSTTGVLTATCRGHTSKVLGVAFSPDGTRLVTTSSDGTVRQWDSATGREVEPPYDRHSGEVLAAVYSPDGRWVASSGTDRTIRAWRATGRQDVTVLHGHTGTVTQLAFAPDGRRLASLSIETQAGWAGDGTVRVWDVGPRATLPVLRGHTSYVYPVAFSPDGHWLASGSWDDTVRLWDAATGEACANLPHPGIVRTLAYGPGGDWLVTGGDGDDRLRIWDVATARVRKELPGPGPSIRSVVVSPDGARVAVSTYDKSQIKEDMVVCDLASGERLFSAPGAPRAYSPDGRWLAVLDADLKTVVLLDARTHEVAVRFPGHENRANGAAFSPDSRRLASCSADRTVRLWDINSGACQVLRGHTDEVFAVAFHPDGTRLASAGRDQAIWLWDLARGEVVARLPGHTSYVWSLAFSPDGTTLASGSGDFTVRLWDTAPLKVRYQARRAAEALRPQAERLVEKLRHEKKDAAEVAAYIRADRSLSEPQRHASLRALLRAAMRAEQH